MLLALVPLVFGVMVLLTARRMGGARRAEAARRTGQGAHAEALRAGDFAAAAALAETHYGPQSAELAAALLALSETAPPETALPALRRALAILAARQAPPTPAQAPSRASPRSPRTRRKPMPPLPNRSPRPAAPLANPPPNSPP